MKDMILEEPAFYWQRWGGGLLSNHRDLRVHHQSCLFHVQCHMYLFWSTGRHTVAIAFSAHSKTQQHLGLLALCGFGRAFIFLLSVYKNICQMVIGPLMSCSPGGGPLGREFIGVSWLCSGLDWTIEHTVTICAHLQGLNINEIKTDSDNTC